MGETINKIKIVLIAIGSTLAAVLAAIATFIFFWKRKDVTTITNTEKAFQIQKDDGGTQILPKTPQLDDTLTEIEKDILSN